MEDKQLKHNNALKVAIVSMTHKAKLILQESLNIQKQVDAQLVAIASNKAIYESMQEVIESLEKKLFPVEEPPNKYRDDQPLDKDFLFDLTELSVRSRNIILNNDVKTVGELRKKTDNEILREPNCGRRTLEELRQVFGSHNPNAITPED
jgi:DNA-directed RNA polymerase alpha subunit